MPGTRFAPRVGSDAPTEDDARLVTLLQEAARPVRGASHDYDVLLERIGNARFVLLGEASHGTHEFYAEPAETYPTGI